MGLDHATQMIFVNNVNLFGTCRIRFGKLSNGLNDRITYPHCTKEIIQFIQFLKGDISLDVECPTPIRSLLFNRSIADRRAIKHTQEFLDLFNASPFNVIEVSSRKKYVYKNYYLFHLVADKRFSTWARCSPPEILNECLIQEQTEEEIEQDILTIREMLAPKPLIVVTHYYNEKMLAYGTSKITGENAGCMEGKDININLKTRLAFIYLVEKICIKHNINCINPDVAMRGYEHAIMQPDLGHYIAAAFLEWENRFLAFVENVPGIKLS